MPELPDLEYIVENLAPQVEGLSIQKAEILNPIVFRILLPDFKPETLFGLHIEKLNRHGPFLDFTLSGDLKIVYHPMLAGRVYFDAKKPRKTKSDCFRVDFTNGAALIFRDNKQMGKVYILREGETAQIPRFETQGPDVFSPEFTEKYFISKINKSRKQVRVFIMEQEIISAIGNAYADETMFEAGLHPKTLCSQLSLEEKKRLYASIIKVMSWGIESVKNAAPALDAKHREHVRVRNRGGQPCPSCGEKIRKAGVRGYDAFFCPRCQPSRRTQFIAW